MHTTKNTPQKRNNPAVKATIFEYLREHTGEWVEPSALTACANAADNDIAAAAEALRAEGYLIEARTGGGWRLTGHENRLIPRELSRELATAIIGRDLHCLEQADSTNNIAWQKALAGAAEGTTVFAEQQTAGRGRLGRAWFSSKSDGLLMSVILTPNLEAGQSHILTAMASVAVAQAIRDQAHIAARIRWPNDIYIGNRKIAGILVEGRALATGVTFVVGIGLNVNTQTNDFPIELREHATSLAIETGNPFSRIETARFILRSLDRWYRDLCYGDMGRIANQWRTLSSTLGHQVVLSENGHEYRGTVLDLSVEDGLIVRLDRGLTRIFRSHAVTLRHLHGNAKDEKHV